MLKFFKINYNFLKDLDYDYYHNLNTFEAVNNSQLKLMMQLRQLD